MTGYQSYRTMKWTSDSDECENACGKTMCEGHYVEGRFGHYCSDECLEDAEYSDTFVNERAAERRQMGLINF